MNLSIYTSKTGRRHTFINSTNTYYSIISILLYSPFYDDLLKIFYELLLKGRIIAWSLGLCQDDPVHLRDTFLQIVVDDNIIIMLHLLCFADSRFQSSCDLVVSLRSISAASFVAIKISRVSGNFSLICIAPWTSISRITSIPRSLLASTKALGVP